MILSTTLRTFGQVAKFGWTSATSISLTCSSNFKHWQNWWMRNGRIQRSSQAQASVVGDTALASSSPGAVQRKVIWNGRMQLQAPFVWTERPTTLQVLYAQEEIWVIKAICQAIAKGNEGSTGPHDAAVTIIEELSIGFDAAEDFPNGTKEPGRITPVKGPAATGASSQLGYPGIGTSDSSAAFTGATSEGDATGGSGALPRPERPDRQGMSGSREGGFTSQLGYGMPSREGGAGGTTGLLVPDAAAPPVEAATSTNTDDYLNDWHYVDANSTPIKKEDFANPQTHEFRLMPWRCA